MGSNRTDLPGSSGVKRLSKIEIYSKVNNDYILFRTYTFLNNSNFKLTVNNADARLKLDGLEVRDGAGTLINSYAFTYQTNTFSWDQVSNSYRRDFFGFYNGKVGNTNLIPQQTVQYQANTTIPSTSNISIGGADKNTDTTYYKEGMLKRITFPTGGYTDFEFEPHKYKEGTVTTYGAGLRIKKIIKNDGINSYSTLYRYGNNDDGFGHKNFDVRSFHYMNTQYQRTTDPNVTPIPQRQYRVRSWISNSVVGPGFDDSPVVYTKVTSYENGSTGNGKTVYEFDNNILLADGVFTVQYSNKTWRNSKSWERGKVTKIQKYNSSNVLLEETVNSYTKYNGQTVNVGQAAAQIIIGEESGGFFQYCPGQNGGYPYDGHRYMISTITQDTGIYLETSTATTQYSGGNALQTVNTKAYHSTYLQPTYEEVLGSSNPAVIRTTYRYPYDIISPTGTYTGLPNSLKQMLLKNMLYPVEEYTWVKPTTSSTQQVISARVMQYDLVTGTTFYHPKFAYFLEPSTLGSTYAVMQLSGTSGLTLDSRHKLRITFNQYDSRGNILQYTPSDGLSSSFLYGYEGSYPIAQFSNASSTQVAYSSFETDEKGGWTYAGSPVRMNPYEAKTGHSAYLLSSGAITRTVSGASSSNKFKLSFWAKAASGTQSWTFLGVTESLDSDWKLIEREITTTSLNINGTNVLVDELRISPINSLATTSSYMPLVGKTSEIDPKGQGVYYLYDRFGRLLTVKNDKGEVLKHYEYTFKK